jgi:hypothetical protein
MVSDEHIEFCQKPKSPHLALAFAGYPFLAAKRVGNATRQATQASPRQYGAEIGNQWSATTKEPSE